MDEEFGAVEVGDIEGVIEVTGTVNGTPGIHEFSLNVSGWHKESAPRITILFFHFSHF